MSRLSKGQFLIFLTLFSFMVGLPLGLPSPSKRNTSQDAMKSVPGSQAVNGVGADTLPNLSLPQPVESRVDNSVGPPIITQVSPDNLTLRSSQINLRLRGGEQPHDEPLSPSGSPLSSGLFWSVSDTQTGVWAPTVASSNRFTRLGTNATGSYVVRDMVMGGVGNLGSLQIVYRITPQGSMKWSIQFRPGASGQFRLVFTWLNVSDSFSLGSSKRQLLVSYGLNHYIFDWGDVPRFLNTTSNVIGGVFTLTIDLGNLAAGANIVIDPTISSGAGSYGTAYTFQRKVFYDAAGGRYWAFYYTGSGIYYRNSTDGTTWSSASTLPSYLFTDANSSTPAVFNIGSTVVVAGGSRTVTTTPTSASPSIWFINGTITGKTIKWGTTSFLSPTGGDTCNNGPSSQSCYMNLGYDFVDVALSSDGYIALSYDWRELKQTASCGINTGNYWYARSTLQVLYRSQTYQSSGVWNCFPDAASAQNLWATSTYAAAIVPSNRTSGIRVITFDGSVLRSFWADGVNRGPDTVIDRISPSMFSFSVAYDRLYGAHVVYESGLSWGRISYAYSASPLSPWTRYTDIFGLSSMSDPVITFDPSTGDIYCLAVTGNSVAMARKTTAGSWKDNSVIYPVSNLNQAGPLGAMLGSMVAVAQGPNSNYVAMIWTSGTSGDVIFGSVPVGNWSPFAYPPDPWDGKGISPYGQYFANLGESVSVESGMLTVRQTDLSIPGRGLDLKLSRIFTEPSSFVSSSPYNYDSYPLAPLGNGWQLDYPWFVNATSPPPGFIHLWDGEGFRLPSSFWNGTTATWENHQGENFRLVRYTDGSINLYDKTGTTYYFNTTVHRLARITDPTGNNTITFRYTGSVISCITDSVGRPFFFAYSNGLLIKITQKTGSCSSPGTTLRQVSYGYVGTSLSSETDPLGRTTSYSYSVSPWLIDRITYPTGWYDSYIYNGYPLGTQAIAYRVSAQQIFTGSSSPIRKFGYVYNQGPGDAIIGSSIADYNTTNVVGYTIYSFSPTGVNWNITDQNNVLQSGRSEKFGPGGEITQETFLTGDGAGKLMGSYTNYYTYDSWGNQIYSRRSINPTAHRSHETFNSYYNNGLPQWFNALQDTFSQNNGTEANIQWNTVNGSWIVRNRLYNATGGLSNQPSMMSWLDIGKGNITLQASINIAGPITNNDGRVGIFVHYPGSGSGKWALVFHNRTGSMYFELLDDQAASWLGDDPSQPFAKQACPITYNAWYVLRLQIQLMIVSGQMVYQANGSVTRQGQTACNGVMGNFPVSSPIASATGFGLYVGGYSALYDNVTVSTDPAYSFISSFIPNGTPGPSIHGALAGTAQYQNGTGSASTEAYYSYYPWGGLNQTRTLYKTQSMNQWLTTTRNYDIYGNPTIITDPRGNSTTLSYSPLYKSAYLTNETRVLNPNVMNPGRTPITDLYGYNLTTGTLLWHLEPNGYGHNTTYTYDILGRLTRVNYPQGDYTSYAYNDVANYADITNNNGWLTRQIYDGLARLSITDRFLSGKSYSNATSTHNWQDKTITSTDPIGNAITYQYDPMGRITRITKPDGNLTQVYYNDTAAWIRYTDETTKNYRCNYYDRLGRLITVVEYADQKCNAIRLNNYYFVTGYYYDEVGNLLRSTLSDFNWLTNPGFEYGNFTGWTQTNFVITPIGAHSGNYAAKATNPSLGFSVSQNLTGPIPGNSITTLGFWYASGDSSGNTAVQVLYSDGTFTQTALPGSVSWNWESPAFDRTKQVIGVKVFRSQGILAGLFLDDFVLRTSQSTLYSYDSLNRVTQVAYPDNTTASYSYDSNSNLVSETDRNGMVTTHKYDSLNRVTNTTYYGGQPVSDLYYYDNNSNLYQLLSQNATITYLYDNRNRVTCESYSLNGQLPSSVGGPCGGGGGGSVAAGTLITMADNSQVPVQNLSVGDRVLSYNVTTNQFAISTITQTVTVQTHDMLIISTADGRDLRTDNSTIQKLWVKQSSGKIGWLSVTQLKIGDSLFLPQSQTWTIVTGIKDIPGSFTMYDIYDTAPGNYIANGYLDPKKSPTLGPALGPTTGGGTQQGYSFAYGYAGERLWWINYNDFSQVYYAYDGLGRVVNVTSPSLVNYYARFSYYTNDQMKGMQYGNGLVTNYTYTRLGQVSTIKLKNSTAITLFLAYQYNNTGTVASVTGWLTNTSNAIVTVGEKYAYDPLQRLINSNVTSDTTKTLTSFQLDNAGNRIRQVLNGITTTYSYNITNNELISSTTSGIATSYAYDRDGNLLSKTAGSTQWTYTWNPSGRLVKVSNNNVAQGVYAYDGLGRRVESIEGGGSPYFCGFLGTEILAGPDYVYAAGLRIARTNGPFYYHTDALGSTRMVTDWNRNIVFSDNYQPYGQDNAATGSEANKFTGKPYSAATSLYYDFQRWYDPSIGRFISQDPLPGSGSEPESLNRYAYASDSPTTLTDPTGLTACPDYCGAYYHDPDFWMAAFIILGSADVHLHLDSSQIGGFGSSHATIDTGAIDKTDQAFGSQTGTASSGQSFGTRNDPDISLKDPVKNFLDSEESVGVIDVPADVVSQDLEASYNGKVLQTAVGSSVHGIIQDAAPGSWQAEVRVGNRALDLARLGARPQIVDIKPYHEGVNPFEEYQDQRLAQSDVFYTKYGVTPVYRYLLYRLV